MTTAIVFPVTHPSGRENLLPLVTPPFPRFPCSSLPFRAERVEDATLAREFSVNSSNYLVCRLVDHCSAILATRLETRGKELLSTTIAFHRSISLGLVRVFGTIVLSVSLDRLFFFFQSRDYKNSEFQLFINLVLRFQDTFSLTFIRV